MRLNGLQTLGLMVVMLIALAGCGDDSTGPQNQNPSKPEINPTGFRILPEASVSLGAHSTDPDGNAITYTWTFSDGTPLTATGEFATWTAPDCECDVDLSVVASDGHGGQASATTTIVVNPDAAYGYITPFSGTIEADMTELGGGSAAKAASSTCHYWASVVVTWTSAVVFVHTALPTAAFTAALAHVPVRLSIDTWIWSYTIPWMTSTALVELQAKVVWPDYLDWKMYISGTIQEYNRFLWVTGQSQVDEIEGFWLLYDSSVSNDDIQALRIEYARRAEDDRDLDYFNVRTGSASYGDSLNVTVRGTTVEGRLHDVSEETVVRAAWDTADGHGKYVPASGDSCCWGPAPGYEDLPTCP